MYVRGYDDSKHDLLSYSDIYPDCTSPIAECEQRSHAPPALADKAAASQNDTHQNATRVTAPAAHASTQPDVVAADITHFGQRNFIGVVVLIVLVVFGLILWMTFGWPKRKMAQLRESLARRRGRGYSMTDAQSMEQVQVPELVRDQGSHSRSSAEYAKESLDRDRGSVEKVQRQSKAHPSPPARLDIR